jgi:hypothetical protein
MRTARPEARLRVQNSGPEPLEMILELYGRDYWLMPGESVVVVTVGKAGPWPWPGTTWPNEPFEVEYFPDMVRVHFNGDMAWVEDAEGREIECDISGRPAD